MSSLTDSQARIAFSCESTIGTVHLKCLLIKQKREKSGVPDEKKKKEEDLNGNHLFKIFFMTLNESANGQQGL